MKLDLVVADTGPLLYLTLIDELELIPRLFNRVIVPNAVHEELTHARSPAVVRAKMKNLPAWMESVVFEPKTVTGRLHAGEASAIELAIQDKANALLMDDYFGRTIAGQSGLVVIGTIGLLERAAASNMVNLHHAFTKLKQTNFFASETLFQAAIIRDEARKKIAATPFGITAVLKNPP